jgi:hypothetical protein
MFTWYSIGVRSAFIATAILYFVTIVVPGQPHQAPAKGKQSPEAQRQATSSTENKAATYYQAEQARKDAPRWYASPEWWLVAIAAITAFAVWKQARETKRAAEATQRATESIERQAGIMERQTAAAEKAASVAEQNVEIFISKERARITIEPGELMLASPNDPFPIDEVSYKVFCHGTTQAFPEAESWAMCVVTTSAERSDSGFHAHASLPSVINPTTEGINKTAVVLGEVGIVRIKKGELFIHFYGSIKYRDVFDRERYTNFRYTWKEYSLSDGTVEDTDLCGRWDKCGTKEDNEST